MTDTRASTTLTPPLAGSSGGLHWTIEHVQADNYLLITTRGPIAPSNLIPFAQAALAAARHCPYLLIDHRDLPEGFSPFQTYHHPEEIQRLGPPPNFTAALVFPAPDPQTRFLDTRMVNEGQRIRVFDTLDEARSWLRSVAKYH